MAANNQKRKPDGRGGKRAGAGRKPETISVRQLLEFERAAKAKALEHGKSLQDIVLEIAYDEDVPRKDRLAAAKLYWDKSVIVAKEGGEADKSLEPAVFLPEKHPRLELVSGDGSSSSK